MIEKDLISNCFIHKLGTYKHQRKSNSLDDENANKIEVTILIDERYNIDKQASR